MTQLRLNGVLVKLTSKEFRSLDSKWKSKKVKKPGIKPGKKAYKKALKKRRAKYRSYLRGKAWAKVKAQSKLDSMYKRCIVCDTEEKIHLHHVNYDYLYSDTPLRNVVPVCENHHNEIHRYAKRNKVTVALATDTIVKKYK